MHEQQHSSEFARMSEARRFQVSEEDPDPRGWTVVSTDGQTIGEVSDLIIDQSAMKVRYFDIEVNNSWRLDDPHVVVDAQSVDLLEGERRVVLHGVGTEGLSSLPRTSSLMSGYDATSGVAHDRGVEGRDDTLRGTGAEAARLTRAEEELRVGKREVEAGEVVVNKHVETEHVQTPVERRIERVRVERRPVTAATTGSVEMREDEIRVPIIEEEIVVEKRPVVKEEIVLTRDVETETEVVDESVRKERVDVHEEGNVRGGRHGRH